MACLELTKYPEYYLHQHKGVEPHYALVRNNQKRRSGKPIKQQNAPWCVSMSVRDSNIRSMVALTGGSSKHEVSLLRQLAEELAALLRRRPRKSKPRKPRQVHRRLSPEQRNQIVDEYRAGASMLSLAKRWKIHRTTITEHLLRAGVTKRPHRRK